MRPARRTGRHGAGSSAPRSGRTRRRSRPRCPSPVDIGARSRSRRWPGRRARSSSRRRPPARCAPPWPRSREALVHGGRAGGAGVLDPGRGLEAQGGIGLEHERAGEVLGDEAAVEMAEPDLVDLGRLDAGIGDRSRAASTIRLSALRPSCLPNGRWLQPTMQAVMGGLLVGWTRICASALPATTARLGRRLAAAGLGSSRPALARSPCASPRRTTAASDRSPLRQLVLPDLPPAVAVAPAQGARDAGELAGAAREPAGAEQRGRGVGGGALPRLEDLVPVVVAPSAPADVAVRAGVGVLLAGVVTVRLGRGRKSAPCTAVSSSRFIC